MGEYLDIEIALAYYFNWYQKLIVPNVFISGGHECDLLVLSTSGYATEIEIKTSKQDLKRDKQKSHTHDSKKIKYLYFAIPEKLEKDIALIPEKAGILIVEGGYVRKIKDPQLLYKYKFDDGDKLELVRKSLDRIWKLKCQVRQMLLSKGRLNE